jgi:hypothetical protein
MDGEKKERKKYRISLTVFDREAGVSRACTLAEAKTWDWGNREKVRSIGPWHIHSYQRLLAILAHEAEAGREEIEIVEAPFFMGC